MPPQPNFERVRFMMEERWSIPRLERYICSHGGGFRRRLLRDILRSRHVPANAYVASLQWVAYELFWAGHTLSTLATLQRLGLLPLWWGQRRPEVQVNSSFHLQYRILFTFLAPTQFCVRPP
jgi:hypothetical protein